MKASFIKHRLHFKIPGTTSRGVLHDKDSWFIIISDEEEPNRFGIGECSIIRGLSVDDRPDFEQKLQEVVADVANDSFWLDQGLAYFPAIRFGLETALLDFEQGGSRILFPSEFTEGRAHIPINGLIWMGHFEHMRNQIIDKIEQGFRCVKLKIGALDFDQELQLLAMIRKEFTEKELELRVDANGAFRPEEAMEKLNQLADFQIHSIEQPIRQGQWEQMADLCRRSPFPIALDEELIGVSDQGRMAEMLEVIKPQYIILKPSLLGGFTPCRHLIEAAEKQHIGWWLTSALESNIGLNAIAQWTYTLHNPMPQGLGTGQLFTNNIPSPLEIKKAALTYQAQGSWKLNDLLYD